MRLVLPLLLSVCAHAATLTIDPPVIYDCTGSVGKATVRWKGANGPVQLVVGSANGLFATSDQTSGAAETGTWVSDGLEFRLVGRQGALEGLAVARVQCAAGRTPGNGLVSESYFPLEAGNRWVYRVDMRSVTAVYMTWTVTGKQVQGGQTYAEITSTVQGSTVLLLLREDNGSLYRWIDTREELYLNPGAGQHAPFRGALGSYPEAVSQTVTPSSLIREVQTFVKGVGLARSRSDLMTGSSGGFLASMELVEFQLASGPKVQIATPRIGLSIDKTLLDVTAKQLDNCAIPCYFVACGFGLAVDPPGTYKPCVRTRIDAVAEGEFQTELTLLGIGQRGEVYRSTLQAASGEAVRYVQVPLYGEGNAPFPAGIYVLMARLKRGGQDLGISQLLVEIR